jgi:pseudouridine-5'-phosphate glycosidase
MMRVGVLHGGLEQESEKAMPPSQKLRVLKASELSAVVAASRAPSSTVSSAGHSPAAGTARPVTAGAGLGFKHDNNEEAQS